MRKSIIPGSVLLVMLLVGCRQTPPPPTAHPESHISISASGYPTQLVTNGTVLVWDLAATDYLRYTIQFVGPNPCRTSEGLVGRPGKPARCEFFGQIGHELSKYKYTICIEYPDIQGTPPSTTGCQPPGDKRLFRIGGCPLCQVEIVGTGDTTTTVVDPPPAHPVDPTPTQPAQPSPQATHPTPAAKIVDPGEQEVSCQSAVAPSVISPGALSYHTGDQIFWDAAGPIGPLTINFPKDHLPCKTNPTSSDYSCYLIGEPGKYEYTIAAAACPTQTKSTIVIDNIDISKP